MTSKEELDPEKSSQGELEEQQLPPEERKNKDALISEEGKGKNEQKSEEGKEHKSKEEQKVHKSREEDQPDVSKPETDDSDQTSPRTVLEISSSSSESDGGGGGGGCGSETSSSVEQSISPYGRGPDSHSLQWRSLISGLIMRKRSMARLSTFPSDDSNQSSPRTMLEISSSSSESDGGGLGSETSSSAEQSISPYGSGPDSHSLQWRSLISGLIMRRKGSMARLSTFPSAAPATRRSSSLRGALERIRSRKDRAGDVGVGGVAEAEVKLAARPSWRSFAYEELAAATDGFSADKLIGKGGHAEVYKGRLVDGQVVAVKRLMNKDKEEEERVGGFLSELGIIAHVNHPNAAQLLGFGVEGGLHLVLQFSPHGSLASVLHGSNEGLDWKVRFKIAIGVAQGLHYLHEGCQRRIIHRDIKASNVLLTEDFQPQISDFGLAKWLPENWDHHVVFPIEGTFGYLAPEYFMHGVVNEKTDVFAFGVLLLELITGRRAVDSSRQSLVIWAKPFLDANKVEELVDPSLEDSCNPNELSRALQVASMCIHHLSTSRPTMNEVVRLLHGEEGLVELVGRDSKNKVARPPMFDACDMDDYTCSRYLSDLHRHKQLALEQ